MAALTWQHENEGVIKQYPDLIQKVWLQVLKDFAMEALHITEVEILTLDDIYTQVYPQIKGHITHDFNALMRLLYRIDISEQKVSRQMDLMPDDTAKAISTLILKREIQKVVLRIQFSANL